jgi:ubiquinone/menaquinone biosynthesis C-methylase UbiE
LPGVNTGESWQAWRNYWETRARDQGESYVGRKGQDWRIQQSRIESLLRSILKADQRYSDGMDFGCGWGRFTPFWAGLCGHVWAVDLVPEQLAQVKQKALNVTTIRAGWPLKLPFRSARIDLLWAGHVFQHIVDEDIFSNVMEELSRVLAPGAKVLILDNAVDKAKHVKPRKPEVFARGLGLLPGWSASKVTVDERPDDHWFIQGTKA